MEVRGEASEDALACQLRRDLDRQVAAAVARVRGFLVPGDIVGEGTLRRIGDEARPDMADTEAVDIAAVGRARRRQQGDRRLGKRFLQARERHIGERCPHIVALVAEGAIVKTRALHVRDGLIGHGRC